jgi:hypothetical protein
MENFTDGLEKERAECVVIPCHTGIIRHKTVGRAGKPRRYDDCESPMRSRESWLSTTWPSLT